MSTAELKPCPFCGGHKIELREYRDDEPHSDRWPWLCQCRECEAKTGDSGNRGDAAEAWNTRPQAPSCHTHPL